MGCPTGCRYVSNHLIELRRIRSSRDETRLGLANPSGGDQLHGARDLHRRFDAANPAADLAKLSRSHWGLRLPDRSTVLTFAHGPGVGVLGAKPRVLFRRRVSRTRPCRGEALDSGADRFLIHLTGLGDRVEQVGMARPHVLTEARFECVDFSDVDRRP